MSEQPLLHAVCEVCFALMGDSGDALSVPAIHDITVTCSRVAHASFLPASCLIQASTLSDWTATAVAQKSKIQQESS